MIGGSPSGAWSVPRPPLGPKSLANGWPIWGRLLASRRSLFVALDARMECSDEMQVSAHGPKQKTSKGPRAFVDSFASLEPSKSNHDVEPLLFIHCTKSRQGQRDDHGIGEKTGSRPRIHKDATLECSVSYSIRTLTHRCLVRAGTRLIIPTLSCIHE